MEKIAKIIARYVLSENENIDFEVCLFGIQTMLELFFSCILVLIITAILNTWLYSTFFLILFSLLRAFAGGYHLNSFFKCTLLSTGVFIMILLITRYFIIDGAISLFGISLSSIGIIKLGPTGSKNRKLTNNEIIMFDHRLKILIFFIIIFSILLFVFKYEKLLFLVFQIVLLSLIVLIPSKLAIKKEEANR